MIQIHLIPFQPFPVIFLQCFHLANIEVMNSSRREGEEDVNVVYNSKRILRDGCKIAAASRAVAAIENTPVVAQSFETALKEKNWIPQFRQQRAKKRSMSSQIGLRRRKALLRGPGAHTSHHLPG